MCRQQTFDISAYIYIVSRAKLKGKFLLNTCMLLGHASIYIMDNEILTACK